MSQPPAGTHPWDTGAAGVGLVLGGQGGRGAFTATSHCFQKALGFLSENRTLHSKLQMAEVVQRQAHSAEQDYEEVIHLLEAEIAELKMQLAGKKAKHVAEIEVMQPLSLRRKDQWEGKKPTLLTLLLGVLSPSFKGENDHGIYVICRV